MKYLGDVQIPMPGDFVQKQARPMTTDLRFKGEMPRKHANLSDFDDATGVKLGLSFRDSMVEEY